jgi:hypothetical protein
LAAAVIFTRAIEGEHTPVCIAALASAYLLYKVVFDAVVRVRTFHMSALADGYQGDDSARRRAVTLDGYAAFHHAKREL